MIVHFERRQKKYPQGYFMHMISLDQWLSAGDTLTPQGTLDNVWGTFLVITVGDGKVLTGI